MNVLFVSCNYPPTSQLFCQRLAATGASVLGIGDVPEGALPATLRESLRAYRHVPDMNDQAAMVAAARELRDRFGTISRVDSNIEHWLPTEAAIRADLDLPGMRADYLSYARSKIGMKKLFADAGVPLMAGMGTRDPERVREFAMFHGFPLFFKPDTGVGALGVFKIDSMEQLEAKLPEIPSTYLVEPFLRGRIVTFDGLADRNSECFYLTSHIYSPVAELIRTQSDPLIYSLRELPERLEQLGRNTVRSFGVRERFFHAEFFETAPGEYQALEMNLRAPGSTVLHLMNYAADLDVFAAWSRLLVHGDSKLDYSRKYHAAHVGRRDAVRYRHTHEEVLGRLGPALLNHGKLPVEDRIALGDECYIIRHSDFAELQSLIAFIQDKA